MKESGIKNDRDIQKLFECSKIVSEQSVTEAIEAVQ